MLKLAQEKQMNKESASTEIPACYHCGEPCINEQVASEDLMFCCEGCKMVYHILAENDLCTYYDLEKNPGKAQRIQVRKDKFAFLDEPEAQKQLTIFQDQSEVHVRFYTPQMHCSSCIWLLEYLHKLDPGIISSRVDFPRKETTLIFNNEQTSIRKIAELLTSIGYEPHISFHDIETQNKSLINRSLIIKLGVAGFCFGNIMLLSFPEYLAPEMELMSHDFRLFQYLNLILGTVVFLFPAAPFFISAIGGIKKRFLNIDAPVALAILITYARSVYDILWGLSPGFLDSMSGIVFFMLIGRFYQDYSQRKLSFDRDFRSFFPAAVNRINAQQEEEPVTLNKLKEGDLVVIHHKELIPADGILIRGAGSIDYSFVTGESEPCSRNVGELLYAGGRQTGKRIQIKLTRPVSQSYLTSLWEQNKGNFNNKKVSFTHALSRNFTLILFAMVALTASFWWIFDPSKVFNTVTAMLIIACPCALLLAVTFANGTTLSILSKNGLYLRNPTVLETLAEAQWLVLDKTGTLTHSGRSQVQFEGGALSPQEELAVLALASQSVHPLSKSLTQFITQQSSNQNLANELKKAAIADFNEHPGKGLYAKVNGKEVLIGSTQMVPSSWQFENNPKTAVHIQVDGAYKGRFLFHNQYRKGVQKLLFQLQAKLKLALLSGDKPTEKKILSSWFPQDSPLLFQQMPEDKQAFIKQKQTQGNKVIMVGDGLNDAVALAQANAGIAVTDDTNLFSPACDGILEGNKVVFLPRFLSMAKANKRIIYAAFGVSILYNAIGLFFAVQGLLSPLIAAIIMPSMTVSIVILTTLGGKVLAYKKGLKS